VRPAAPALIEAQQAVITRFSAPEPGRPHITLLGLPATKVRRLIDTAPLFSDPEPAPLHATTESPPPMRNPFQAPDFEEETSDAPTSAAAVAGTRNQPPGPLTPQAY